VVLLALSLLCNVAGVVGVWVVAAPRGGFAWLLGKTGTVRNVHSSVSWNEDRAEVFRLISPVRGAVVFAGDSLTAGFPWAEAFPGFTVRNRGIDGNTTFDLAKRLDTLTADQPYAIFLMIGVNDLANGATPDDTAARIDAILARLRELSPRSILYVQSLLPAMTPAGEQITGGIPQLNTRLRAVAQSRGAEYIDLHSLLADEEGLLRREYARGVLHVNARAYAVWRDAVSPFVAGSR